MVTLSSSYGLEDQQINKNCFKLILNRPPKSLCYKCQNSSILFFFNHCIRFHPAALPLTSGYLAVILKGGFPVSLPVDALPLIVESTISQAAPQSLDLRPFQHRLLGHLQSLSEFLVLRGLLGLLDEVTLVKMSVTEDAEQFALDYWCPKETVLGKQPATYSTRRSGFTTMQGLVITS